jgi:hypothetical protein
MDAIDRYIERLSEPAVRAYWRKIHGFDEEESEPEAFQLGEDHIMAAEKALGITLPPSYRKLVLTTQPYGGMYGVCWVWDGNRVMTDIVTTKESGYSPFPSFLIAVVDHENGDADCFDTRHPDERGEYPIVHFDHEIHNEESTDFETVARDLGEYLLNSLGGETPP